MTSKQTLIRNTLFASLFAALGFFCTGCAVYSDLYSLGTTRTEYGDYHYEMSPDGKEIVFTSKRTKEYNYLPFYGFLHHTPAWTSVSDVEERIPLDPLPDNLSRFSMIVETASDAPPPKFLTSFSIPKAVDLGDGDSRRIMMPDSSNFIIFEGDATSNYAGGIYEFKVYADDCQLHGGETLHLRVRPAYLQYLNRPFRIRLYSGDGETDAGPAVEPGFYTFPHGFAITGGSSRSDSDSKPYLMFPVSADGDRIELLTDLGSGPDNPWLQRSKSLYPFREKQMEEIAHEYQDHSGETPTVEAVCWKVLWFPASLVADVIALPYYAVIPIAFMLDPPTR